MTQISTATKQLRTRSRLLWWLGFLLNIIPVMVFVTIGFINGTTEQKVSIGFTAIAAIILGCIMMLSKMNVKRSIFWIVFIGLYFTMQDLYPMIITMGACTFVDELLIEPLHNRANADYHTNKQIDKRI